MTKLKSSIVNYCSTYCKNCVLQTFATESPSDFGKSKMTTPAPRLANLAAAARPRPEAAPVTIADIPKTIFSLFSNFLQKALFLSKAGRCWPDWLTFCRGAEIFGAMTAHFSKKKRKNSVQRLQILPKLSLNWFLVSFSFIMFSRFSWLLTKSLALVVFVREFSSIFKRK